MANLPAVDLFFDNLGDRFHCASFRREPANLTVRLMQPAEDDRMPEIMGRALIKFKAEPKVCQFFVDFNRQQK
jgi:hypothetical protein